MSSIRRYDVQAKWSVWLSILAGLSCLGRVAMFARNWNWEIRQVIFRHPLWMPLYLSSTGVTLVLSVFGVALGFNSAGQRRNELQRRSWVGFFMGSGVFTLAVILFAAFWLLRMETAK
ncbi:MAG: hypothetical protein GY778_29470 [bacterium]|nr:hypothetical protein [bacterium]